MPNPLRGGTMTHTPAGEPLTPDSPHERLADLHDEVRRALACAERYGAMQAAELSGISYSTIRRWCRKLDIPTRGGLPAERCEMPDDYSGEDPLIPGVPVHHITLQNLGAGYILTREGTNALVDWGLHYGKYRIDNLTRAEGPRLDVNDLTIPNGKNNERV